ncbi:MAG: hypothetical protein COA62_15625 [Rhodobiaceae bacterium]|nr:MAG: hypothetical protein COA62_15625 [Rhodobiaceae bacterium]
MSDIEIVSVAEYESMSISTSALASSDSGGLEDYLTSIQALLPPGPSWTREGSAILSKLLEAFALEYKRVGDSAVALLRESHPLTTTQAISDWESLVGIPDYIVPAPESLTIHKRRAHVLFRLNLVGRASPGYLIEVLNKLGFPGHTITEFTPFRAGLSGAGSAITNDGDFGKASTFFTAGISSAGDPLVQVDWEAESTGWTYVFRVSGVPDPSPSNPVVYAVNRFKPAHSKAIFGP